MEMMNKQEFVEAVSKYIEFDNMQDQLDSLLNIETVDSKLNTIADDYLKLVCKDSNVDLDFLYSWIFESHCGKDKELCSIWNYGDEKPKYVLDTLEKVYDYFNVETKKPKTAKWIISSDGYYPYCSECHNMPNEVTKKCSHCGAIMENYEEYETKTRKTCGDCEWYVTFVFAGLEDFMPKDTIGYCDIGRGRCKSTDKACEEFLRGC